MRQDDHFFTGKYKCRTALTTSDTTIEQHPAVAPMNIARRGNSLEQPLPYIFAGTSRCNQATSRACESGHCSCAPHLIDRFEDLRVDEFVQVTKTAYALPVVGAPHPTFTSYKVMRIGSGCVTLHATVDVIYKHRIQALELFWSPDRSCFFDSTEDIFLYHYGFVSDLRYAVGSPQMTKEYTITGVFSRPVYELKCMRGNCRLSYDGAEHGIFRLSKQTSFCVSLFYLFDEAKLTQRCDC